MGVRHGNKKTWVRITCIDGKRRAFLCPTWTNRHKHDGEKYDELLYECAHCGVQIRLVKRGLLKQHVCDKENDEE